MVRIVILCGWRGSGKDTVAEYLVKNNNYMRLAFADELKQELSNKYSIPLFYFNDRTLKEKKLPGIEKSPRELCIEYGENIKKIIPEYWVNKVIQKINKKMKEDQNSKFVISDCRFPIELLTLKGNYDCVSYWIDRFEKPPSQDLTELSIEKKFCDYVIKNNKTKEELYKEIEKM
jgi:dephospho-CoA kinase